MTRYLYVAPEDRPKTVARWKDVTSWSSVAIAANNRAIGYVYKSTARRVWFAKIPGYSDWPIMPGSVAAWFGNRKPRLGIFPSRAAAKRGVEAALKGR